MNIICFDLDGTLLNEDDKIHPSDRSLLASRKDVPFIITTGRALSGIKGVFERNELFSPGEIPFPIVAQNGAVLYKPHEEFFDHCPFDSNIQFQVINTIRNFDLITFFLFEKSDIFVLHENPLGTFYAQFWYMPTQPYTNSTKLSLTKIMGLSDDAQFLQEVADSISSLKMEVETSFSLDFLLEITPPGIDKGNGLQKLLHVLDLQDAQIFMAGDGGNDLPLFNLASRSYAPISGSKDLKALADVIINREASGVLTPMLADAGLL